MQLLRDDFDEIIGFLRDGKTILMPTDTIWGIVCDALQPQSIQKIYQIKQQEPQTGLVVLVSDLDMLRAYVPNLHPRIETLLIYHRRPLTILYEHVNRLPTELKGKSGHTAIRLTLDPLCKAVIQKLGSPIVAASAHLEGTAFPTHFGAVSSEIISKVDYVMRYRQEEKQTEVKPSVIARLGADEEFEFIRE